MSLVISKTLTIIHLVQKENVLIVLYHGAGILDEVVLCDLLALAGPLQYVAQEVLQNMKFINNT